VGVVLPNVISLYAVALILAPSRPVGFRGGRGGGGEGGLHPRVGRLPRGGRPGGTEGRVGWLR
jgi:hypothetical protein